MGDVTGAIRQLPHHVLAEACVARGDRVDPNDVRQEFISWVAGRRGQYESWQHAWNDWTGAAEGRPGMIRMHVLCPDCRGRMYSTKHGRLSPCTTCSGRKRVWVEITALWRKP